MEEMLKKIMDDQAQLAADRKRVRSGGNVPPAPAVHKGQTRRYRVRAVTKDRKAWWKKHIEARYFSDVCIDSDSLVREFPQLLRQTRELHMEFIFVEPGECNLHLCLLTAAVIHDIVGTSQDTDPLVLTGLNICPPYRAIQHILCGPQSMVQWTKLSGKRYHQSLPYAQMLREA
ncbi:hypothetical protein H5410_036391 [Solanum commersonii]|uniref:Uncharacterized protein n=1 Tax=Solanum commersonii TaxID=4109 RepID=A0A9J5Y5H8_SOLCO|nr:hypothetical protein H5410_036391 [Solanum commersonii]